MEGRWGGRIEACILTRLAINFLSLLPNYYVQLLKEAIRVELLWGRALHGFLKLFQQQTKYFLGMNGSSYRLVAFRPLPQYDVGKAAHCTCRWWQVLLKEADHPPYSLWVSDWTTELLLSTLQCQKLKRYSNSLQVKESCKGRPPSNWQTPELA